MNSAEKKSTDPRKVELKFQLRPGSRAILEASPPFADATARRHHQMTTYFDTPDSVLSKAGFRLSVRQSGGSHIQTVKSRANHWGIATSRSEWDWPIGGDGPDITRLSQISNLAKFAQSIEGRLVPVFFTDIRRTTRLIYLKHNTIVEAALD